MADDEPVYVPNPDDLTDDEAQELRAYGCGGVEQFDPWFESADQAETWQPPAGFDSERV